MGSKENRLRANWQAQSIKKAVLAEQGFFRVFDKFFENTNYEIISRPTELNNIYLDTTLDPQTLIEIYTPDDPIDKHGIVPDFSIKNKNTNKTIFIDIKRQDGWVEGLNRSAGRGNVHERSCRYFTPGLQRILREHSHITNINILPFWIVFVGNITRDPCRVREITCWYEGYEKHFFFWRDERNNTPIIEYFLEHIQEFLD